LLRNPSDEFIRFIVKDFYSQRVTTNIIDKFRPIVKKSISNAMIDMISDGLYQQEQVATEIEETEETDVFKGNVTKDKNKSREIITTEDELKSFEYIKSMLAKYGRGVDYLEYP
jgi:hypothetical protein